MQVIEQRSPKYENPESAEDHLAGLSHLDGFVFGYVDTKENRVVMFFKDVFPSDKKIVGQHRRTLVLPAKTE